MSGWLGRRGGVQAAGTYSRTDPMPGLRRKRKASRAGRAEPSDKVELNGHDNPSLDAMLLQEIQESMSIHELDRLVLGELKCVRAEPCGRNENAFVGCL